MNTQVTVKIVGNKAILVSPYHPALAPKANMIGGVFNRKDTSWSFDARDEGRVLELAREVYGIDGRSEVRTVSVHIELTYVQAKSQSVWMVGREIVKRPFRDARVRLGNNVILVEGEFPARGGSQKYPQVFDNPSARALLEVRDVPLPLAQQAAHDMPDSVTIIDDVTAEVANPLAEFSNEDLLAELKRRGVEV